MGVEPMTPSLPRTCSTTELQQHRYRNRAALGGNNPTPVGSASSLADMRNRTASYLSHNCPAQHILRTRLGRFSAENTISNSSKYRICGARSIQIYAKKPETFFLTPFSALASTAAISVGLPLDRQSASPASFTRPCQKAITQPTKQLGHLTYSYIVCYVPTSDVSTHCVL